MVGGSTGGDVGNGGMDGNENCIPDPSAVSIAAACGNGGGKGGGYCRPS